MLSSVTCQLVRARTPHLFPTRPARSANARLIRPATISMLGEIRSIFGGGGGNKCTGECSACDPDIIAKCQAPEPGSVTPHAHHVLVRLPPNVSDPAKEVEQNGAWWPESVDKEPAIEAVNAAIKANPERVSGKVKVTAFDDLDVRSQLASVAPGLYEVMVFPAGVRLSGLALEDLGEAVVGAIAQEAGAAAVQEPLEGMTLLVCCHGKRDSRCGVLGTQLAHRLVTLLQEKRLEGQTRVFKTSHVGGHVYAGNVLVYGPASTCNGDWFGGVNADNVEEFLGALLAAKVEGSADPKLRKLWRGCVGLSKDGQKTLFEQNASRVKDIEDLKVAA